MEIILRKNHEDHVTGKGRNSLHHYNLVHKFIPLPQAMKIPAAEAAVNFLTFFSAWSDSVCDVIFGPIWWSAKRIGKIQKFSAWNLAKVRNKSEVNNEARNKSITVQFASLMDIGHLNNAELQTKHQKYEGRVVLRGDIGRDDSDSHAVFTEQGWIISTRNDDRKSNEYHFKVTWVRKTSS